jgi:hypothetical protein
VGICGNFPDSVCSDCGFHLFYGMESGQSKSGGCSEVGLIIRIKQII